MMFVVNRSLLCAVATVLFLASCSSGSDKKEEKSKETIVPAAVQFDTSFTKEKIINKINCKKDTSQSYSLYLPAGYTVNAVSPVIYFFDSHASGAFPVRKYSTLADKYGYIMAGSNNSQNGQDQQANDYITTVFMEDVQQRFSIDKNRMYTAGFSGGSRVASSVAINKREIAGVIGCAAGFPGVKEPIRNKFSYFGIAGDEDCNLGEMQQLNEMLDQSSIAHDLLIFSGKHEWPPEETMDHAFAWLELNAMKDNVKIKNDSIINLRCSNLEMKAAEQKKKGRVYEAMITYEYAMKLKEGLQDVSGLKKEIENLKNSETTKAVMVRKEEIKKQENDFQVMYSDALRRGNFPTWEREVQRLNKAGKDKEESKMNKRLLGYLSLSLYMYSSAMLKESKWEEAGFYLNLYRLVDPANAESWYLSAVLAGNQGDGKSVLDFLEKAKQEGFVDFRRMREEPAFSLVNDNTEFKKMMKNMKE